MEKERVGRLREKVGREGGGEGVVKWRGDRCRQGRSIEKSDKGDV